MADLKAKLTNMKVAEPRSEVGQSGQEKQGTKTVHVKRLLKAPEDGSVSRRNKIGVAKEEKGKASESNHSTAGGAKKGRGSGDVQISKKVRESGKKGDSESKKKEKKESPTDKKTPDKTARPERATGHHSRREGHDRPRGDHIRPHRPHFRRDKDSTEWKRHGPPRDRERPSMGRAAPPNKEGRRRSPHHAGTSEQIREMRDEQRRREHERRKREGGRERAVVVDRQKRLEYQNYKGHRKRELQTDLKQLERRREKLRLERERIQREKQELIKLERERQKAEREKIEREKDVRRAKLNNEHSRSSGPVKRPYEDDKIRRRESVERKKPFVVERGRSDTKTENERKERFARDRMHAGHSSERKSRSPFKASSSSASGTRESRRDVRARDERDRPGKVRTRSDERSHRRETEAEKGAAVGVPAALPAASVPPTPTPKLTLDELTENNTADEYAELTQVERWVRSAPDELYYDRQVDGYAAATERTRTLCERFESSLLVKCRQAREEAEKLGDDKMQELIKIENEQIAAQKAAAKLKRQQQRAEGKCCSHRAILDKAEKVEGDKEKEDSGNSSSEGSSGKCSHKCAADSDDKSNEDSDSSSSSGGSSSEDEDGVSMTRSDTANRELERRKKHPRRMHEELWHNDPGLMNDGPVCRCSAKARRFGIRHGFYPGENRLAPCEPFSNNKTRLYHYRITISPPKNFLISTPTVINHDNHEYIFEGFSIFSHYPLDLTLPPCKVIRFNIKYDVFVEEERFPESFCVRELLLFETYLFREILELVDLKYDWTEETGCTQFHLMPRFVRQLPDNGQEVLSMSRVLIHLLKGDREVVKEEDLHKLYTVEQSEWQNFADRHKGTIVTKWGMKPCALRVDQIDRDISGQEVALEDGIPFPLIVHFGIRPPQLSYAGNAGYQRAWRRYVKYRHLLSNMPKPSPHDKLKLLQKEMKLQAMRTASNMKRDVTVAISAKGFRTTGICCDLVQHAMLIPVLVAHLRFHKCLETLEKSMIYTFQNRFLLQLAMTHPSYRENFGTNPDHARNALTNCGIRQPEYGDRRIHYASTRKRGINTLINIMAKFGADHETESEITHNERLEFLGDAVVEFTTSIHLFHIFPDLEEGGLATYRAAIVQNQHLAVLAQTLNLDQYMLYAHGSDLCHDSELRHAMANCFEALMGALFLDGGIEAADRVFGATLFGNDMVLLNLWANYPKHPLQQEEPSGDRHWVQSHEVLQKLAEFEEHIGVNFNHIRLLARAFTDRSLGYNNLTKGSNQRLEFLGDTVLQLISSEYLYRHFPDHHEGHLSLLRSSLVNNRTQSHVCEDLGMPQYAMRGDPKSDMKTKDKADLLEAFLGALFIDKGLKYCITFCQVCFFPRLSNSITKQEWNDPKSKLQQCCLTLRAMDGREPDIPVYKVTESLGPTNTRTYIVAVYFRGKRLATAQGHSIQEAEMNAAAEALEVSGHLFPQLHHQRRIMDKTSKKTH